MVEWYDITFSHCYIGPLNRIALSSFCTKNNSKKLIDIRAKYADHSKGKCHNQTLELSVLKIDCKSDKIFYFDFL